MSKNETLSIENAQIVFRNFSGKPGKYNAEGRRNFCVLLDDDYANKLSNNGWNVRWLEPREEGQDRQAYVQVSVSFENIPPKIVMISSRGKTKLDEESVNSLDWADLENVDVIIRPYHWEVNGKKGVKAYLKTMYVTIVEDEFEHKYYDAPDSAESSIGGCGHCDTCDGSCHDDK